MIIYEWVANLWVAATSVAIMVTSLVFMPVVLDVLWTYAWNIYKNWGNNDK